MYRKILILIGIGALFFAGCSKKDNGAEQVQQGKAQTKTENTKADQEEEKKVDYADIKARFEASFKGNTKGGITIYGDAVIMPVPDEMEVVSTRIFGNEDDGSDISQKMYKEVQFIPQGLFLEIQLPEEIYDKHSVLNFEAEHDGKTFFYDEPLSFSSIGLINSEKLAGYRTYITFANYNYYSKNYNYTLCLKDAETKKTVAKKTVVVKPVSQGFFVYKNDYESPFISYMEQRSLETDTRYHMIYRGKGSKAESKGTMLIISADYGTDAGFSYIPLFAVKTFDDKNGTCTFDFEIAKGGQYKIDFYDCETKKITTTSIFDYIQVRTSNSEVKYFYPPETEWKVNAEDGLRLRNYPMGKKIGLLENGTELVQTEYSWLIFSDTINGIKGFWIPVRVKTNRPEIDKSDLYCCDPNKTDGWVFSGYLDLIEK